MTKLEKLQLIHKLIVELISSQAHRKFIEQARYEQRKANEKCTAAMSCKRNVVPFHTMCSYHLGKQATASSRRDAKRRYNANNT